MTAHGIAAPLTRRSSRRPARRSGAQRALRWAVAVLALAAVVAGIVWNEQYRSVEAFLAGRLLDPFVTERVQSAGSIYWTYGDTVIGFRITAECTGLILIGPLLTLAATLLATTRVSWARTGLGVISMIVVVTIVNEFRLALIGFATVHWGIDQGYVISHTFVGSFIGIIGFVAGLIVLLLIMLGRRRLTRRAR
jgi:exosortase/archaeosortase family protein